MGLARVRGRSDKPAVFARARTQAQSPFDRLLRGDIIHVQEFLWSDFLKNKNKNKRICVESKSTLSIARSLSFSLRKENYFAVATTSVYLGSVPATKSIEPSFHQNFLLFDLVKGDQFPSPAQRFSREKFRHTHSSSKKWAFKIWKPAWASLLRGGTSSTASMTPRRPWPPGFSK